jgi:hypothetical protein
MNNLKPATDANLVTLRRTLSKAMNYLLRNQKGFPIPFQQKYGLGPGNPERKDLAQVWWNLSPEEEGIMERELDEMLAAPTPSKASASV